MTKSGIGTVGIEAQYFPFKWKERLLEEGKIGGVMFVFLEGESHEEIKVKVGKIQDFCKQLKTEDNYAK